MAEEVERSEDGRVARRIENRTRIVDALFALIQSGRFHPTLKEIAEKAGVTSRTLLNHFPDAAALRKAAVERGRERAERSLPALPTEGGPEERVEAFMHKAAGFFDRYAAVRWSAATSRDEIEAVSPENGGGQVMLRIEARVRSLLLEFGLSIEQDPELEQAVRLVIDPLSWRVLRVHQRLTRQQAAAATARAVIALARDGLARDGRDAVTPS